MQIYNSLTQKKEDFEPRKKGRIEIYVCGPTVYDDPHIGHARSAYIFDVIVRYLRYKFKKDKVIFVRNITDIDDKIINKARQQSGDIKKAVTEITEKYTKVYHEAMDSIGLDRPDKEPKATEHIKDMQSLIKVLLDKGFAYEKGGDVYFSVRKFDKYGELSKRDVEGMRAEARVKAGENKEDPLDFALWKKSKPDEPEWSSPWGKGRPGWHIECSAMSGKYFKGSFDIHGGGLDLIFPHHENEIAQSRCAGYDFAKYWIHNGLLTINNQKMAKSLGNFVTVGDFLAKFKDADLLKLVFLSAHYRSPVDYTEEKILEMKKAKERFTILFDKIDKLGHESRGKEKKNVKEIDRLKNQFIKAMDNDFNTSLALGTLFDLANFTNKLMMNKAEPRSIQYAEGVIKELSGIFGLFQGPARVEEIEQFLSEKIKDRERARKAGKFKLADDIRKELAGKGIILEDTKEGTTWRRRS